MRAKGSATVGTACQLSLDSQEERFLKLFDVQCNVMYSIVAISDNYKVCSILG